MASKDVSNLPRPAFKTAVRVLGGYVWEHDVNPAIGEPISDLRPHYAEGEPGYPKDGYPSLAELKNAIGKTTAEAQAAKRAPVLKRDIEA